MSICGPGPAVSPRTTVRCFIERVAKTPRYGGDLFSSAAAGKGLSRRGTSLYAVTNRRLVTLGVLIGIFLAGIEGTVVSTAMPTIAASLGGLELYSWIFASYMLFAAVSMPIHGKLSDVYGRKKFFFLGVALFVLGSVLSGMAQSIEQLVAFRALQGIGGGALFAIPYTILGVVYPPEMRGKAIGYASAVWGISSIVGPLLGFGIVAYLGWRWVFYLSVPVGLASVALVARSLEENRGDTSRDVDYAGAATLSLGVGAVLVGLQMLESGKTGLAAALVGLGVLGLAGFYVAERRAQEPILPLKHFRDTVFLSTNAAAFLSSFAIFGAFTYAPLYLQGIGGGPGSAAMAVFPIAIGWSFTAMVAGRLVHRAGERKLVSLGGLVLTLSFAVGAFWTGGTPRPVVLMDLFFMGVGMGLLTPPLLTAIQNHFGAAEMGVATSSQQFFRNVGGTVGVVVLGLLLVSSVRSDLAAVEGVSGLGDLRTAMEGEAPAALAEVMAQGMGTVFAASVLIGLAVTLIALLYVPRRSTE